MHGRRQGADHLRGACYSLPASLARCKPSRRLRAEHLEVVAPGSATIVAMHARSLHLEHP